MRSTRWALALACAIAFCFRALVPLYNVFQAGFINFQETDAWFHVRVMEHLVRHFPFRLQVDPYGSILDGQRVDTGPFYDWIPALLALPFPDELQTIAAWYPAILGVFIIVAVYFLAQALFDETTAALAALVAAVLPGHFLAVSSLGFTDHHVMESLLSLLVLYFLAQRRHIAAGLTLAAYVLTFVGGAFLVAIVIAWAAYGFLRDPKDVDYAPNLPIVFAIPLVLAAPFHQILWMEYTLAALAGGIALTAGAALCRRFPYPRAIWLAAIAVATAAVIVAIPQSLQILRYLAPSRSGAAAGVGELQSMWFIKGYFSLEWPWMEFGGVLILAMAGIPVLFEIAVRNRRPALALFTLWSLSVFGMAMMQVRMAYYFAPAAAIVTAGAAVAPAPAFAAGPASSSGCPAAVPPDKSAFSPVLSSSKPSPGLPPPAPLPLPWTAPVAGSNEARWPLSGGTGASSRTPSPGRAATVPDGTRAPSAHSSASL